jgi:hypothetical protein
MGYETQLEFIDVEMPQDRFPAFRAFVEEQLAAGEAAVPFAHMLHHLRAMANDAGYLDWNLNKASRRMLIKYSGDTPVPVERVDWPSAGHVFLEMRDDDGDTLVWGKWRPIEEFVNWLCGFCTGGRVIQYSLEGDGAVGGWEFNERGQYRELCLVPVGKWTRPKALAKRRRR